MVQWAAKTVPTKFDEYDKKILTYVFHDARMPITDIAKKIGISVQRCHYKLERLKKELITSTTIVNFPALNIPSYVILCETMSEAMAEKLYTVSGLFFFMRAIGQYDYAFIVVTDDLAGFCEKHMPGVALTVHPIIAFYPDPVDLFQLKIPYPKMKIKNIGQLDATDYKILAYFSKNPIQPFLQANSDIGIDRETIKRRVERLREGNIIMSFRQGINTFKLGRLLYFVHVETNATTKRAVREAIDQDTFCGFIFETNTGFFFHHLPVSHAELFQTIKSIRAIDPQARINAIQNVEPLKVETTPQTAIAIFEKRAAELK